MKRKTISWLAIGSLAWVTGSARADESFPLNVLELETRTRNDKGVVRCGLFKEAGWLKDAFRSASAQSRGRTALCVFKNVPPGTYGMSAFHDEDNDGKLDTNFVGYPTEEYCASRNARNMFSAPSWSDAKFRYRGGTSVRLKAIMK